MPAPAFFGTTTLVLLKRVYASDTGYRDAEDRYAHRIPDTVSAEQRQALADAGAQPNHFIAVPHDEAVVRLQKAAAQVDARRAADAFVASLGSSSPAWLTVLPATALGLAMPAHAVQAMKGGACSVCFYTSRPVDRTLRAYYRHVQGAGWGTEEGPLGGVLALEDALALPAADWPQPTPRDVWVFHQLLDLLRGLAPTNRQSHARDALKRSALLGRADKYRCSTVLEALATLGVLETPDWPGLFTRWTTAVQRDERPNTRVEVPAPLAWWRAADGLNDMLVQRLFGHLKRPLSEPAAPAKPKAVARRAAAAGSLSDRSAFQPENTPRAQSHPRPRGRWRRVRRAPARRPLGRCVLPRRQDQPPRRGVRPGGILGPVAAHRAHARAVGGRRLSRSVRRTLADLGFQPGQNQRRTPPRRWRGRAAPPPARARPSAGWWRPRLGRPGVVALS